MWGPLSPGSNKSAVMMESSRHLKTAGTITGANCFLLPGTTLCGLCTCGGVLEGCAIKSRYLGVCLVVGFRG